MNWVNIIAAGFRTLRPYICGVTVIIPIVMLASIVASVYVLMNGSVRLQASDNRGVKGGVVVHRKSTAVIALSKLTIGEISSKAINDNVKRDNIQIAHITDNEVLDDITGINDGTTISNFASKGINGNEVVYTGGTTSEIADSSSPVNEGYNDNIQIADIRDNKVSDNGITGINEGKETIGDFSSKGINGNEVVYTGGTTNEIAASSSPTSKDINDNIKQDNIQIEDIRDSKVLDNGFTGINDEKVIIGETSSKGINGNVKHDNNQIADITENPIHGTANNKLLNNSKFINVIKEDNHQVSSTTKPLHQKVTLIPQNGSRFFKKDLVQYFTKTGKVTLDLYFTTKSKKMAVINSDIWLVSKCCKHIQVYNNRGTFKKNNSK